MTAFLDELEEHIPALRRYARALTRNREDADDLVQDCLERALRKQALWRPSGGSLRPWLFKILLNLYRNGRRGSQRALHAPLEAVTVEPAIPASQPQHLALNEVARALEGIPHQERAALLLVALEGASYAEAAEMLEVPQGTVMSRLHRARARLRHLTTEDGGPRLKAVK